MSEKENSREHRELLEKIEQVIAGGGDVAKDANGSEDAEANSLYDFCALLAKDAATVSDDFRSGLLARVQREVYGQARSGVSGQVYEHEQGGPTEELAADSRAQSANRPIRS